MMKVLWSFSGLVPFMKEPLLWARCFMRYLGQFSKLFLQIDEHLLPETSDSGSRSLFLMEASPSVVARDEGEEIYDASSCSIQSIDI